MTRRPLAVALVHHPVLDRRGEVITTAVTNLDLHDIARTARTYGVQRYYLVTPVTEQQVLVARLLAHWRQGFGATYNPHRGEALGLLETVSSLEDAQESWSQATDTPVEILLTGASRQDGISFGTARRLLAEKALLLVLGTGWGLAPVLFAPGRKVLAPIVGTGDYNHLPVRAAAAIILDRLLGDRDS